MYLLLTKYIVVARVVDNVARPEPDFVELRQYNLPLRVVNPQSFNKFCLVAVYPMDCKSKEECLDRAGEIINLGCFTEHGIITL